MAIEQNIKLAVDTLVFDVSNNARRILLIERKNKVGDESWALPGGFVEDDETPLEAAKRELEEETGVKLDDLKQMHTFGAVNRDPRFRVVSIAFIAKTIANKHSPKSASDAKNVKWFELDKLPKLAFDHSDIIEMGVKNLEEFEY